MRRKKEKRIEVEHLIIERALWRRKNTFDTRGIPGHAKVGGEVWVIAVPKDQVLDWSFEQLNLSDWTKAMQVRQGTKNLTGKTQAHQRIDSRKITRRHYIGRWRVPEPNLTQRRESLLKRAETFRDWAQQVDGVIHV